MPPPPPPPGAPPRAADEESSPTIVDEATVVRIPILEPVEALDFAPTSIDARWSPSVEAGWAAPDEADFSGRYRIGEVLGEGGMGEVRLATDTRIGRSVAMKAIRPESAQRGRLRARFLFEAKVQGQLEHPSIAPVYDLGVMPGGALYFTMKRLRGKTLHDVLRGLRLGDRQVAQTFTRRRLLAAFQSVCLAVEFAHQRGVVHRDLKPSNIMLGEFGEVSVLDWGLAKLVRRDGAATPSPEGAAVLEEARALDATRIGEVLGTPGYMSPEQAIDSQNVGPATDVFALGSILFEVLTHRQLVPGATHADVKQATVAGAFERRINKRFPEADVPPELEEVCVRATEPDPEKRFPHARSMADAVERYLEGDLDVARRRKMAGHHTREAIRALAESVGAEGPDAAKAARARAIREVNHALAIDPQNQTALRTLMKILTELPTAVAPEAEAAIRASEARARATAARRGSLAYLAVSCNVALMGLLGVARPAALAATCACFLGAALVTYLGSRGESAADRRWFPLAVIALSSLGVAATSLLFGAFIYAPSLCAANVVVISAGVDRRLRWGTIAAGFAAILAPVLLERLGVLPPGWSFQDGVITVLPRAVRFPEVPTLLLLGAANLGTVLFPALLVGAERDARTKAERELLVRAHHLDELVPPEVKAAPRGPMASTPE